MIPLFRPNATEEEEKAVLRVLRSGWWAQGPETEKFEDEFATYVSGDTPVHAAATNSCTSALELAARALMPEGGLAIVPAFTFVSSAQAMQHAGLQVVFADIDDQTLCIDWDHVHRILQHSRDWKRTLVVPVWYGGTVHDIPPDIPRQVKVLEDCAHAAGAPRAGTQGTAAAWSFHAVKNLATGDGGMVTSGDSAVIERVKRLRWCGIDKSTYDRDTRRGYSWDYNIPEDGEKAHMNDLTAALGRVQLKRLDDMNWWRRKWATRYIDALYGERWLKFTGVLSQSSNHMFVIRVPAHMRDKLIDHLISQGVSGGVHYKPLYKYPAVFGNPAYSPAIELPVTEQAWQEVVTLPLFPGMTAADQDLVIDAIKSFRN